MRLCLCTASSQAPPTPGNEAMLVYSRISRPHTWEWGYACVQPHSKAPHLGMRLCLCTASFQGPTLGKSEHNSILILKWLFLSGSCITGKESSPTPTLRSENLADILAECFSLSVEMSARFSDLKVGIREISFPSTLMCSALWKCVSGTSRMSASNCDLFWRLYK